MASDIERGWEDQMAGLRAENRQLREVMRREAGVLRGLFGGHVVEMENELLQVADRLEGSENR